MLLVIHYSELFMHPGFCRISWRVVSANIEITEKFPNILRISPFACFFFELTKKKRWKVIRIVSLRVLSPTHGNFFQRNSMGSFFSQVGYPLRWWNFHGNEDRTPSMSSASPASTASSPKSGTASNETLRAFEAMGWEQEQGFYVICI